MEKNSAELDLSWDAHKGTISSILFIPEKNILVSSSFDDTLKFWNLGDLLGKQRKPKLERKIEKEYNGFDVNCLLRYDENSILCGTDEGMIFSYSLHPGFVLQKKLNINILLNPKYDEISSIFKLLRGIKVYFMINNETDNISTTSRRYHRNEYQNDHYSDEIVVLGKGEDSVGIFVIDFAKGSLIHHHPSIPINIATYSRIVQSLSIPNSIFVNVGRGYAANQENNKTIKLIDWKSGEMIKTYDAHESIVSRLTTFINDYEREIILAGGSDKMLFFYDVISEDVVKTIDVDNFVCGLMRLGKYHFLVGSCGGRIKYVDVRSVVTSNDDSFKSYESSQQDESIDICFLKEQRDMDHFSLLTKLDHTSNSGEIRVAIGTNDSKINIVKFRKLQVTVEDEYTEAVRK